MNADPRSIVTPDAFSVTPDLLGTPLAEPWRRFVALLLDLVLIGFLQLLGWRILGGIAGLMLLRMATKRPEGATTTRAQKWALGCAGTMVFVVAIGVTAVVPAMIRMMSSPDDEAAVTAVETPTDGAPGGVADAPATDAPADIAAAALRTLGADDSIAALIARVDDLEDDLAESHEEHEELRDQLAAAESRSTVFTWVRDAADEAGLIFGWGTVYLTLFLALWQGRTPGKKAMGLRVVRLNGQPLGLYMSLERAGGYMAGFATGLLGFAQIWWDPNRQAIHDKITETVVIRERMPNRLHAGRIAGEGVARPVAGVAKPVAGREDSSPASSSGDEQDIAGTEPQDTGGRQS